MLQILGQGRVDAFGELVAALEEGEGILGGGVSAQLH